MKFMKMGQDYKLVTNRKSIVKTHQQKGILNKIGWTQNQDGHKIRSIP